jgi:hypothetical protein
MRCNGRFRLSIFSVPRPVDIGRYSYIHRGLASERLRVQLAFGALVGASGQAAPPDAPERRYALREVKARLHQASFRDAVLAAYGGARSRNCLSRDYSMPLTSSWTRTSS